MVYNLILCISYALHTFIYYIYLYDMLITQIHILCIYTYCIHLYMYTVPLVGMHCHIYMIHDKYMINDITLEIEK